MIDGNAAGEGFAVVPVREVADLGRMDHGDEARPQLVAAQVLGRELAPRRRLARDASIAPDVPVVDVVVVRDGDRRTSARECPEGPAPALPLHVVVQECVLVRGGDRWRQVPLVDLVTCEEVEVGAMRLDALDQVSVREPEALVVPAEAARVALDARQGPHLQGRQRIGSDRDGDHGAAVRVPIEGPFNGQGALPRATPALDPEAGHEGLVLQIGPCERLIGVDVDEPPAGSVAERERRELGRQLEDVLLDGVLRAENGPERSARMPGQPITAAAPAGEAVAEPRALGTSVAAEAEEPVHSAIRDARLEVHALCVRRSPGAYEHGPILRREHYAQKGRSLQPAGEPSIRTPQHGEGRQAGRVAHRPLTSVPPRAEVQEHQLAPAREHEQRAPILCGGLVHLCADAVIHGRAACAEQETGGLLVPRGPFLQRPHVDLEPHRSPRWFDRLGQAHQGTEGPPLSTLHAGMVAPTSTAPVRKAIRPVLLVAPDPEPLLPAGRLRRSQR